MKHIKYAWNWTTSAFWRIPRWVAMVALVAGLLIVGRAVWPSSQSPELAAQQTYNLAEPCEGENPCYEISHNTIAAQAALDGETTSWNDRYTIDSQIEWRDDDSRLLAIIKTGTSEKRRTLHATVPSVEIDIERLRSCDGMDQVQVDPNTRYQIHIMRAEAWTWHQVNPCIHRVLMESTNQ